MSSANIICLCHRILLLVCRIINNLTILSPLVAKRCKKIPYFLYCYSLVWADSLKSLICTAILAIPSALEDPTDQNSDAAREVQSSGRGTVATVTACCWSSHPFWGQHCGKEHFTLEHGGKILPIPMNKMRTPGQRHTYKHMN